MLPASTHHHHPLATVSHVNIKCMNNADNRPDKVSCFAALCCRKGDDAEHAGSKRQKPAANADQPADLQFGRLEMSQTGQLGKQQPKKKKASKEQLLQEALQKQKQKNDGAADFQVDLLSAATML